jgi:CheY-like chemotaxis protein
MPNGGTICILASNVRAGTTELAGLSLGDYVRFEIQDNGAGMSPAVQARALEPFYTTKEIGKGTGLGLSMVHGFTRQSGGDIRIESEVGCGTTITMWLPRAIGAPLASLQGALKDCNPLSLRQVVLVEDEASVREMLSHVLSQAGFSTVTFEDGEAAFQFLRSGGPCVLLISDQSMPGMKGSDLVIEATRLRPDMPAMIITGFDKVTGLDELQGHVTVLRKPFRRNVFLNHVRHLVGVTVEDEAPTEKWPYEDNVIFLRDTSPASELNADWPASSIKGKAHSPAK